MKNRPNTFAPNSNKHGYHGNHLWLENGEIEFLNFSNNLFYFFKHFSFNYILN